MTSGMFTPRGTYSAATVAWFYERGYWTSETLPDVLDRRAAADPDRPLIIDGETIWPNERVRAAAYRVASGLRSLGIRAGERVAVQLPNWPEYVLTYFALAKPTLAELTAFLEVRFRLAKQKLPEVLRAVPELPMTTTGKVSKQELWAQARLMAQKVTH